MICSSGRLPARCVFVRRMRPLDVGREARLDAVTGRRLAKEDGALLLLVGSPGIVDRIVPGERQLDGIGLLVVEEMTRPVELAKAVPDVRQRVVVPMRLLVARREGVGRAAGVFRHAEPRERRREPRLTATEKRRDPCSARASSASILPALRHRPRFSAAGRGRRGPRPPRSSVAPAGGGRSSAPDPSRS